MNGDVQPTTRRVPRTSILLALVALVVAACPAAALASKPRVLHVACAKKHGGRLRYVTVARGCRRAERPVRFTPRATIRVCVGGRGVVRRARRCGVRRELVLPAERRRVLCVNRRTRVMRAGRCRRRRDFKVVVMGRPPAARPVAPPVVVVPDTPAASPPTTTDVEPSPTVTVPVTVTVTTPPPVDVVPVDTPPVARADEATTDEDTAVVVRVLDNDTGVDVRDLDMTGTTGAVAPNPDGTVTYDPRERFDALGPDRARDRHVHVPDPREHGRSEPVTVFLTVTGVDDPSVIGVEDTTLAYDTGSRAIAVSPVAHVDGRRWPGDRAGPSCPRRRR